MFVFKRLSTAKGFYQYAVFYAFGTIDLLEENTINSIILCKQILQFKKHNQKLFQKIV
jgi:hypothetical protein